MGLMQIMPKTYAGLRVRYGLGADPYNPHDNILAGPAYLREMHDRYGTPGFLATYNAGLARYDEHFGDRSIAPDRDPSLRRHAHADDRRQADRRQRRRLSRSYHMASLGAVPSRENVGRSDNQTPFDALPNHRPTDVRVVDLSALAPRSDGLFVHASRRRVAAAMSQIVVRQALSGIFVRLGASRPEAGDGDVSVRVLHLSQLLTDFRPSTPTAAIRRGG